MVLSFACSGERSKKNQDNEEMLDAIHLLKHFGEIQITTDAGDLTLTLKLKD